jgi:hypothetical protein
MASPDHHPSPAAAALAGWADSPNANARVVSVTVFEDRAEVVVDVETGYRDWVYCARAAAGWREVSSGNGPYAGWRSDAGDDQPVP